jgi:NAD(P)-dependent dehydrogenase (short-subunit alcohol dehydrogenase family)
MKRLENKVAVITGASLGIGRETALTFVREGAKVAITDVLEREGIALQKEIEDNGGEANFWKLDVSKIDDVKQVMQSVYDKWGSIDVLVNNAGIGGANVPTHELSAEDWQRVLDVNVSGVFYCSKYVIPFMKKQKKGSIINLSSIYGIVSAPDVPAYHASKGAVRSMSKTDALLYATDGIRVNSVHPGFIDTPMVQNHLESMGDQKDEARKALISLHPLGHLGEAADIANGILYLACDESKFVTGSELVIDGGYTAR